MERKNITTEYLTNSWHGIYSHVLISSFVFIILVDIHNRLTSLGRFFIWSIQTESTILCAGNRFQWNQLLAGNIHVIHILIGIIHISTTYCYHRSYQHVQHESRENVFNILPKLSIKNTM